MLVRVDISAGTNGVLSVALSHQSAGFAPYRIDNCTAATLHLRQVRFFQQLQQLLTVPTTRVLAETCLSGHFDLLLRMFCTCLSGDYDMMLPAPPQTMSHDSLCIPQAKCSHASDVLRPYSALDYAWDEPGLPHTLLLELPGSRSLGAFDLDKVTMLYAF